MAITALLSAFDHRILSVADRILFLRARFSPDLIALKSASLYLQQTYKPVVDELIAHGYQVSSDLPEEKCPLILILPPRQRDEARATYAHAIDLLEEGGRIVVSILNNEGAKAGESDLADLIQSKPNVYTKHKSRVMWVDVKSSHTINSELQQQWKKNSDYQQVKNTPLLSKPGMFSWNHVDPASALLAEHLPDTFKGIGADLGAGYGYLSYELLKRNPNMSSLHLYEAEAEALKAAQLNISEISNTPDIQYYWHDVTKGLHSTYDFIISNPPFHSLNSRANLDIGMQFINSAARALRSHGEFWMVANSHLAYENMLETVFHDITTVTQKNGFKVICAKRPY